jgi:hypothetical protein
MSSLSSPSPQAFIQKVSAHIYNHEAKHKFRRKKRHTYADCSYLHTINLAIGPIKQEIKQNMEVNRQETYVSHGKLVKEEIEERR